MSAVAILLLEHAKHCREQAEKARRLAASIAARDIATRLASYASRLDARKLEQRSAVSRSFLTKCTRSCDAGSKVTLRCVCYLTPDHSPGRVCARRLIGIPEPGAGQVCQTL